MKGGQHLLGLGMVGIDLKDDLADGDGLQQKVGLGIDIHGAGQGLDGFGVVAELAQAFAQLEGPLGIAFVLFQRGI
jgi:hypothetical protein